MRVVALHIATVPVVATAVMSRYDELVRFAGRDARWLGMTRTQRERRVATAVVPSLCR